MLTHYLNRYMALIILEERLLKLYVNTFELDIYRRKRVGKETTLSRVNQSLLKRCLESKLGRNIFLLSPFIQSFPRMYCIFHFHRKKVILPVFPRGSGKGHYWKTFQSSKDRWLLSAIGCLARTHWLNFWTILSGMWGDSWGYPV